MIADVGFFIAVWLLASAIILAGARRATRTLFEALDLCERESS